MRKEYVDTMAYIRRIRNAAAKATNDANVRWDAVQLARHIAVALNAQYRQGYEDGISGAERAQLTGNDAETDETARRFIEDARKAYRAGYTDGAADRKEV